MSDGRKLENHLKDVSQSALNESEKVSVNSGGKLALGGGATFSATSLSYYLAGSTTYFGDGFMSGETPLYLAFFALTIISSTTLESICGKVADPKAVAAAILTGIGLGLAPAAILTAIFFASVLADIATFGLFSLAGAAWGWYSIRKGRKVHAPCGTKLKCQIWICPKCMRFINPTHTYTAKDRWDIFDLCQYLDVGSFRMNVVQAMAYLEFTELLENGDKKPGLPALWKPKEAILTIGNDESINQFSELWTTFITTNEYLKCQDDFRCKLLSWLAFRENR